MPKSFPHLKEAPQIGRAPAERLDSWKEIAGYLKRDVRTVQRWEESEGLPVYRLAKGKRSPVYAYTAEIDAWLRKNPEPKPVAPVAKRVRYLWPAAVALVLVAAIAVFLWLRYKQAGEMAGVDPNRVVVAPPENRTGDSSLESLGRQITDAINRTLRQVGEVKIAETPGGSGSMDYRRLAGLTKSGLIIAGAYYLRGGQVELQWKIVDPWAENRLLCAFAPIPGPVNDPAAAIDLLCQRIAGAVAFQANPLGDLSIIRSPRLDAYREYQLGNKEFGDKYENAIPHYERALAIDPEFHMARFMIYYSRFNQRKYELAESQLAMLEAAQGRMTVWESGQVKVCRASFEGRLPEAIHYLELLPKSPKLPNPTYLQGGLEMAVNRPGAAVKSLAGIPLDWSPQTGARAWPSKSLAQACHLMGDFKRQLQTAEDGRAHFPDVLDLYGQQAMALAALGRLNEMDRVIDECLAVQKREDSGTPASVMEDAAFGLRADGHREKALEVGKREIRYLQNLPVEQLKTMRISLGKAYYITDQWEDARKIFEELAREQPPNIEFQGYLGAIAARLGNRAEAERIDGDLRRVNPRYKYGRHLYCRARIASLLGEEDKAVEYLSEAFSQGYRFSISAHHEPDFEPLRDHPRYQDLVRPKG